MKFRVSRSQPDIVGSAVLQEELVTNPGNEPGRNRWSTAFLVAGSALMGATALAFWNRRTISGLRSQIDALSGQSSLPASSSEDEIV